MASTAILIQQTRLTPSTAALLFLKFQDQTAFVVPAVRASAVRQAHFIALRAAGKGRHGNAVVGPPFVTSGFGRFSFRYTHLLTPIWNLPAKAGAACRSGENYSVDSPNPVFINLSFAKGDCVLPALHRHASSLRLAPHPGHMPLQSSRQSTLTGKARKICSATS